MKRFTLSLIILLIYFNFGFSQGCLPDGIGFTSQDQIDNFQSNYPGCEIIQGSVVIYGESILNLDGLNVLTEIEGSLFIGSEGVLGPIPNLNSLIGLINLVSIGGHLCFLGCHSLKNLHGLENLSSIGGSLIIGRSGIYEASNDSLISLTGIENINPSTIDSLTIVNNQFLSVCEVNSICSYLLAPNGTVEIHGNAQGCNSNEEVEEACESVRIIENSQDIGFSIYPNPAIDQIRLDFNKGLKIESLCIYNQIGQNALHKNESFNEIDVSNLDPGLYLVEIKSSNKLIRKKFVKK